MVVCFVIETDFILLPRLASKSIQSSCLGLPNTEISSYLAYLNPEVFQVFLPPSPEDVKGLESFFFFSCGAVSVGPGKLDEGREEDGKAALHHLPGS